jgi:hypothetical protein
LYAQQFQSYAAPLNINDEAKCLMFFSGLKSDIQKACTMAGHTSSFMLWSTKAQAITFDQLSYQHSKRESGNSSESGSKKQRRCQDLGKWAQDP